MFAALALGLTMAWGATPAAAAAPSKKDAASAKASKVSASSKASKAKAAKAKAAKAARAKAAARPTPSVATKQVADWVVASGDSGGLPFMVIDKVTAQVFVYEADGQLRGGAPALLGLAQGDRSVPGIGDRKLSSIRPGERTTPAGRFIAAYGPAVGKTKVLWVDYATAISIHPVVTSNPKEQRLKRLASRSPRDNRITYGCINVNAGFYENVVRRTFTGTRGVVYILPETEPIESVFPAVGGGHMKASVESRPDPAFERGTANAEANGEPASVVASNASQPEFDPIIELGTARSLAAGDVGSDAVDVTDTPPLEPDPVIESETPPEETRTVVRAQPEPDRILEFDYAASGDIERAASEPAVYGPAP